MSALKIKFLFFISILTITTQYHVAFANDSDENAINILEMIKNIANDDEILNAMNVSAIISNNTSIDETETDEDYESEEDETESPKIKNILRWLPKRKKKRKAREENKHAIYLEETNRKNAILQHKKRLDYIVETMHTNFWTTSYLWTEVQRMKRDRAVMDEMRLMIETLESPGHEQLKKTVLDCYNTAKMMQGSKIWDDKKTNNLIIHVIKDPDNENVHN